MAILTTLERLEEQGVTVTVGGTQGPQGPRGDLPQAPSDIAASPSVTIDASVSAYFRIAADQNFTLNAPTSAVDGQRIMVEVQQDVTGSRLMTLGSGFNTGPFTVVLSTTPNAKDILGLCWNEPDSEWMVLAFARGY